MIEKRHAAPLDTRVPLKKGDPNVVVPPQPWRSATLTAKGTWARALLTSLSTLALAAASLASHSCCVDACECRTVDGR